MIKNNLEKLEYYKILENLANYSHTYIGKEKCLSLSPSFQKEFVQNQLHQTEETVCLIERNNTPPIHQIADNTISLKILESSGILSIESILEITQIFQLAEDLKKYFLVEYINPIDFPFLSDSFSMLYTNPGIIEQIVKSITEEKQISDQASPVLQTIRRKQRNIEQDIKNKLNNMIHSSTFSKYIQESVIMIRNDRYVVPVKEEYRSQVKGFIHDVSSSGSTVFIEPIPIFELNNELNNLKIEESIEIEKILQKLSSLFYPYIEELKKDIEIIGHLDFLFAKAYYSKSIKGITPKLSDKKEIYLKNARHPLLDLKKAVPLTLNLGKDFKTLVITGPNTGGKTVTLKTIGLLTLMCCSGLNIPADENSTLYVFDHVYADIGDEQSISDSLSTFSSHMLNIVEILKKASSNSLILVDELGSGTDPLEGASLAISILDNLCKRDCLTIATTHYQEIKKYALTNPSFENASVEFDIETLTPTYHLLIGIPGKSNAFEISQKLGLDEDIIQEAKSLLEKKDIQFEEILKSIYEDKIKIEKEKDRIINQEKEITSLKEKLQKDYSNLLEKEQEKIEKAKQEARNILLEAKEEASEILKKLKNTESPKELEQLRNSLNAKVKNLSNNPSKSISNSFSPQNSLKREDIHIKDTVFITTWNQTGIVLSNVSKSNEVQIQIGNLKTNINIKNLQKATKPAKAENQNKGTTTYHNLNKAKIVHSEINVIGLTVEEAILIVDKFLDDCVISKLETARIVHGKGTGKLRQGIHQFLKTNPHIKDFRLGTFGEGEMGVTVVTLK